MRLLRPVLVALAFAVALPLSGCGTRPAATEQMKAGRAEVDDASSCPPADAGEKASGGKAPKAAEPARGGG